MLNVFVFTMLLFTSSGPGLMTSIVGDEQTCKTMITEAQSLIGKEVPGPGGTKVLALDVQASCQSFTQRRLAKS